VALLPIRSTAFAALLARLGAAPSREGFQLDSVVVPVSLVDSDITIQAVSSTPLLGVPASAGEIVAPAAGSTLATTGPLNAGPFSVLIWIGTSEANSLRVRRRNAADTADIWSFRLPMPANTSVFLGPLRVTVAQNEAIRVDVIALGGAGQVYQADIFFSAG
jgi:hypothetical protein